VTGADFLHDHPDFGALLSIVAGRQGVAVALVEKDYWVTHTLWALVDSGLRVWFKGGTSLSKGFRLIQRFSEDLDVKLESPELPEVTDWNREGTNATSAREFFFKQLSQRLRIPGASVEEMTDLRDRSWRSVVFKVEYPGRTVGGLPESIKPFVQLEVGSARVTPGEERLITSWVHEHVAESVRGGIEIIADHRPRAIHCVWPEVTLLEKIEAVSRRFARDPCEPASFVRHYEDATRIVEAGVDQQTLRSLLQEMEAAGDIRSWREGDDVAFNPDADRNRWESLEAAWRAIDPLF
jgi:hypothetical protein